MLSVNSVHQFFSPGQDFALSGIGPEQASKIARILGEAPGEGTLLSWGPDLEVPLVGSAKSNRCYWIQSKQSGFAPYSIDLDPGGRHEQDNWIQRTVQFFTFRGESPFQLQNLSSYVKSKIRRIHRVSESGDMIVAWSPSSLLNPFVELPPGVTCIVESVSQGFGPYDIGIPTSYSSSSSSSSSVPSPDAGEPFFFLDDALLPEVGLLPYQY